MLKEMHSDLRGIVSQLNDLSAQVTALTRKCDQLLLNRAGQLSGTADDGQPTHGTSSSGAMDGPSALSGATEGQLSGAAIDGKPSEGQSSSRAGQLSGAAADGQPTSAPSSSGAMDRPSSLSGTTVGQPSGAATDGQPTDGRSSSGATGGPSTLSGATVAQSSPKGGKATGKGGGKGDGKVAKGTYPLMLAAYHATWEAQPIFEVRAWT